MTRLYSLNGIAEPVEPNGFTGSQLQRHSTAADNRRMAFAPARRRQLAAIPLLCLCGLLAFCDFFMLGIAVGFGPDGFGGDGTVSPDRVAVENSGIVAGFVGLAFAVVALAAFLVLVRNRRRNKVFASLVGAQGLTFVWLLASMMY